MAERSSNPRINATASSSAVRPSSSPLRHRPLARAATSADISSPLAQSQPMPRRRSSFMTNDSFDRQSLQSSTHDLLLPRLMKEGKAEIQHESTHLHSAPLALALLPAVGGLLFNNGSAILTDLTLLVLASIFLNWSVRLPWDWYHSAQSIRLQEEEEEELQGERYSRGPSSDTIIEEEDDPTLPDEKGSDSPPPPQQATSSPPKSGQSAHSAYPKQASAIAELRIHEVLALLACFISPVLGAFLLHHIRKQLSRPSEGLVSDYNLSIFLLAAELRPLSHMLKMIQARTLHLQRVVATNPHVHPALPSAETVSDLATRLDELEAHVAARSDGSSSATIAGGSQASPTGTAPPSKELQQQVAASVRASLQPDLDAVTRATRRYEKRATVLGLQMESRLADIEARMRDALALAAGAERVASEQRRGGLGKLWGAVGMLVGAMADATAWVVSLPLRVVEWSFVSAFALVGMGTRSLFGGGGSGKGGGGVGRSKSKGATNGKDRSRERLLAKDVRSRRKD